MNENLKESIFGCITTREKMTQLAKNHQKHSKCIITNVYIILAQQILDISEGLEPWTENCELSRCSALEVNIIKRSCFVVVFSWPRSLVLRSEALVLCCWLWNRR